MFLVGSYSENGNSKAVYTIEMDNNKLSLINSIESGLNPSFVLDEGDDLLLLNEVGDKENLRVVTKENHSCQVFPSGGIGPCHLERFGDFLAVSNYTSGSISLLKKHKSSYQICDVKEFKGSGPNKDRQESSHVHSSFYNNQNEVLYVADLGCDCVTSFKVIKDKLVEVGQVFTDPGDGSRIMVINGSYAYVVNELSNTISVLNIDSSGKMEVVGRFDTLPSGCNADSIASHIAVNNNKLYVSNRGYDSIVVFDVNEGYLENPSWIMLKGAFPRHFTISGNNIIIANQESNTVEAYSIEGEFLDSLEVYKPTVIVPLSSI